MTAGRNTIDTSYGLWRPVDLERAVVDDPVREIIQREKETPVIIGRDLSLRAKVLDACGMTCTFCHNEGTPVASNGDINHGDLALNGLKRTPRVSVFSETNGVNFVPGMMEPADPSLGDALQAIQSTVGSTELHLTGGEPSLHPRLPELIATASELGYSVKMTSNGERGGKSIPEYAAAGLKKINFSIFGTTPEELAMVQHERFQNVKLAQRKLDALKLSIATASEHGIAMSANIVMSDFSHADRVVRLIEEYDPQLEVRILPDLDRGDEAMFAIYRLLTELGAMPTRTEVEAGSSNARVAYVLPSGREIYFKQTRPTRIPACDDCHFNNPTDCKEGYYGLRLYVDSNENYLVGVCIQRMDITLPLNDFLGNGLASQVVNFREMEYQTLQAIAGGQDGQY